MADGAGAEYGPAPAEEQELPAHDEEDDKPVLRAIAETQRQLTGRE